MFHHAEMKRRDLTLQQTPTCGAGRGQRCELSTGMLRTNPHRDRELLAAEELESEKTFLLTLSGAKSMSLP
jgi:hypothetical protein